MCLSNKPALRFVLGAKKGKEPFPCSQASGTNRNGQPWDLFTQAAGASSGPTANLRVGLLGLLLPPFYKAENGDSQGPSGR